MSKIKVLLADDHTLVRQGLLKILEGASDIEIVAEASDGLEVLRRLDELAAEATLPDVLLLDISMPRLSGLEVARRVKKQHSGVKIVILSMHEEEEFILKMVRVGASGYLIKDSAATELIDAIRSAYQGKAFFSPAVSKVLAESYREVAPGKEDPYDRLNDREREIMHLVAEGHTNKAIAEMLFISAKTVDNHRTNLMRKLNVHSAAELVRWAARKGLVD